MYNGISVSVPFSCEYDGNYYTVFKLGVKFTAGMEGYDKAGFSLSTGYTLKASVNDGPYGTIENRKNDELNRKAQQWKYLTSPKNLWEYFE